MNPDEPIQIVQPPEPPNLPGSVVLRESQEQLIDAMGADLMFQAQACVRRFGDFHIALSGGSTPEPFYRRLMYDPNLRELPWKRTHLWIVDERRVPFDDDRSNFKMIREWIVDHSDIPASQVHPIMAVREDADVAYEADLREHLGWREKGHDRLDYVLLGMGQDCHTASLFPNSPALDAPDRLVVFNEGPSVTPPEWVTMTYDLLNASRMIAVMVTGEGKRDAIRRVADREGTRREIPILGVDPKGGELRWYLDHAACPGAES